MEEWNVEALAEIPLRREKNGTLIAIRGKMENLVYYCRPPIAISDFLMIIYFCVIVIKKLIYKYLYCNIL
jgi:hypothetical protein